MVARHSNWSLEPLTDVFLHGLANHIGVIHLAIEVNQRLHSCHLKPAKQEIWVSQAFFSSALQCLLLLVTLILPRVTHELLTLVNSGANANIASSD